MENRYSISSDGRVGVNFRARSYKNTKSAKKGLEILWKQHREFVIHWYNQFYPYATPILVCKDKERCYLAAGVISDKGCHMLRQEDGESWEDYWNRYLRLCYEELHKR